MELIEFEHPIARDLVTRLRCKDFPPSRFRAFTERLGCLLAVEATRNLPTTPVEVETPLELTLGEVLKRPPVLLPVLRAGLGMLPPFMNLLPDSPVAFAALKRNEETALAQWQYHSIPNLSGRTVIVLDPMLATGGTAVEVVRYLLDRKAGTVILVTVVAAPEGIARLKEFTELTVITANVDRELDENWFIRPGLGDFGDRLFSGGS
jgi:uracil phosphoribosyltransferase